MTVTSTPVWHDIFRKVTLKPDNITLEAETYEDTLNIVRGPGVNFGSTNTGTDTFEINVDYDISVPAATTKISLEDVNGNLSEITLTPGRGVAINRISAQELEFESFSVTETDTLHTVTERNNITSNKIFVNNIEVGTIASNSSEDGFTGYDAGHNLIGDGTLDNPMRFSPLYQDSIAANNTDQFEFIAVGPGTLAYAANYVFDTAATTGSVTLEREDPANPGNWTTLDTQSGNTVGVAYFIDGTYSELYSGSVTYRLTFSWTGNTGTATWYTTDTFEGGAYTPIANPQIKTDTDAKTVNINDIEFFQNTIRTTASNTDVVFDLSGTGQVRVLGNITADMLYGNVTGDVTGNVSGNAGTVTNGVYTTGSYANPTWITSLDGTKVTNAVLTTGSYANPSWITSLDAAKIVGEINLSNIIIDGTINIYDNVIETTVSNANLELRANGTGVVSITDDATVSGSLTATQLKGNAASGIPAITTSTTTLNSSAWGANGINLVLPNRLYVDTTSPAGNIWESFVNVISGPTVDSTNVITIDDLATLYVGTPSAAGNSTATRSWAIYSAGWVRAQNFVGSIGATTQNSGDFTTISASQQVTFNPANSNISMSPTGSGTVTINPATAGNIDNMAIGTNTRAAGNFTNLDADSNVTLGSDDTDSISINARFSAGAILKSSKSNGNTLNIAAYDVDGAVYSNLITLTASNTPTLALTSTGVGNIDNMTIGASTRAAGNFTTLDANGNVTLGSDDTDTITTNGYFVTGTQLKSAKTNANTLSLAAYDVDGATYTNLITLTASNTPTLGILSIGALSISSAAVGTMDNVTIGGSTRAAGSFTRLTVSAGTASIPPITLTSGVNLSAATAGTFEFDGTTINFTPNTDYGRAAIPTAVYTSGTGTALTPTATGEATAQALFPAANDTITLPIGTYRIEMTVLITRGATSTTSATARINLAGGGGAVGTFSGQATSSITTTGAASLFVFNGVALTADNVVTAANAAASGVYNIYLTGILRITTAGTFIPKYSLSANLAGATTATTVSALNYMVINSIATSGSAASTGGWA